MAEDRFILGHPEGTQTSYPLLEAKLIVGQTGGGGRYLLVQANARPAEWSRRDTGPEPPTVEISLQIAKPDPSEWTQREFAVQGERDAWLWYAEAYETMHECVVSI